MKFAALALLVFFAMSCSPASSSSIAEPSMTPTPDSNSSVQVGDLTPLSYDESRQIDEIQQKQIQAKQEKLVGVPPIIARTDFTNYRYPFGTLKDGKLEQPDPNGVGGVTYTISDLYYADLRGDRAKEAIVLVDVVHCGGSCDGGSLNLYFFMENRIRPTLIGKIITGSYAYGCAIRSLLIENRRINIEQFGQCSEHTDNASNDGPKFSIADITQSDYGFVGDSLKRFSSRIVVSPEVNVFQAGGDFIVR